MAFIWLTNTCYCYNNTKWRKILMLPKFYYVILYLCLTFLFVTNLYFFVTFLFVLSFFILQSIWEALAWLLSALFCWDALHLMSFTVSVCRSWSDVDFFNVWWMIYNFIFVDNKVWIIISSNQQDKWLCFNASNQNNTVE